MKELDTLDMIIPVLSFGKVYFNVPGGNQIIYNNDLIKLVKDIGKKYGNVKGSDLKKGIHYIYYNTKASSKREIKMLLKNVPNAILADKNECKYVFRCSYKNFIKIISFIIEKSDYKNYNDEELFSEKYIKTQMVGLRYVAANGISEEIINTANNFIEELHNIT